MFVKTLDSRCPGCVNLPPVRIPDHIRNWVERQFYFVSVPRD